MPLDPATEKRIRDEAVNRGVDPDKAVAHAEGLAAKKQSAADSGDAPADSSKGDAPLVDKLLIGHLPFVKVRELRTMLGLPRIADDEMTCGAFAAKYGGGAAAAPADEAPPA